MEGGVGLGPSGVVGPIGGAALWPSDSDHPDRLAALVEQARAEIAAGSFAAARARAESVLRATAPPHVRVAALMVAGDAAYGMKAYRQAVDSYRELWWRHELAPEAPRAAFALGWAELGLGRRDDARRVWAKHAEHFPADARTPTALILAAEISSQDGDTVTARRLLDRAVGSRTAGPEAAVARLNRAILSVRQGRTREAARDLRVLVRSARPALARERSRLLSGLVPVGAEGGEARDADGIVLAASNPFERFAAPFLGPATDGRTAALVLHGLTLVAAENRAWPEVGTLTNRLVDRFPDYAAAPVLLAWVTERAVAAGEWSIARASYETMRARYRSAGMLPRARVDVAEALFRTGAASEAEAELTRLLHEAPGAAEAPRALFLLAEVEESLDRPREALAAYERLRRDYPFAEWTAESLLPHARLLQHMVGREEQARSLLEEIARRAEGDAFVESSFRLAQVLSGEGDHGRAVERYTAAFQASTEDSPWHRPAVLGAGRSLAALNRGEEAMALCRRLLPPPPPEPLPRGGSALPAPAEAVGDPEVVGEAAHLVAALLRGAGRNEEALDMYLTAAYLAPDSPWGRRALVGAVQTLVAIGDRMSAETVYQRLLGSSAAEPELLAEARLALRATGGTAAKGGR